MALTEENIWQSNFKEGYGQCLYLDLNHDAGFSIQCAIHCSREGALISHELFNVRLIVTLIHYTVSLKLPNVILGSTGKFKVTSNMLPLDTKQIYKIIAI